SRPPSAAATARMTDKAAATSGLGDRRWAAFSILPRRWASAIFRAPAASRTAASASCPWIARTRELLVRRSRQDSLGPKVPSMRLQALGCADPWWPPLGLAAAARMALLF